MCDADGRVLEDLIISAANQEHGTIALRSGSLRPLPDLPVGTPLRILPNHACATAAQYAGYTVLPAESDASVVYWPRFNGR